MILLVFEVENTLDERAKSTRNTRGTALPSPDMLRWSRLLVGPAYDPKVTIKIMSSLPLT